ncbi:hypothetical protein [Jannaschia donghaensis]|uniref:Lipoprotein n=1 Tax=Jannaschia donghaensis TaxID=420998 RepID=A0A0M6YLH9_9RHOB|nr:hypothetical protein [Jannaschia donghaensis]CTQ50689.1 hypothetical protein JDO7802_02715 [Jannaschia donghaensis]
MNRFLTCIALPFVLIGCAPTLDPVWVNPGAPALQAEQDFLACSARARQDFPERSRITTSPRITLGTGLCRSGACIGVGTGSEVFDSDRNEPLRTRAVDACMQAKGYRQASLPACPAGSATVLASQPFDTRGLCVANGRIAAP